MCYSAGERSAVLVLQADLRLNMKTKTSLMCRSNFLRILDS